MTSCTIWASIVPYCRHSITMLTDIQTDRQTDRQIDGRAGGRQKSYNNIALCKQSAASCIQVSLIGCAQSLLGGSPAWGDLLVRLNSFFTETECEMHSLRCVSACNAFAFPCNATARRCVLADVGFRYPYIPFAYLTETPTMVVSASALYDYAVQHIHPVCC